MTVRTRLVAVVATGLLIGIPGLLTTEEAANAVSVVSPSSGETHVLLDAPETSAAATSYSSALATCSSAINQAVGSGIYFSDWARQVCQERVHTCAADARAAGRSLSGALFVRYSDGGQGAYCLVR